MAKSSEIDKKLLSAALEYWQMGFSIIPIKAGSKMPALKSWKPYQTQKPDIEQLKEWFDSKYCSMAVILGAVSGGLTCRDFDEMGAYENWASKHPDLAQTLPTVKTSRGRHVYFKSELDRIKKFDDGELKGGGYCLLPPSVHPNGTGYEWLIPINGNLITIEPEEAGFLTQHTQHTKQAQHTQQTHTIKIGVNKKKVQEIIKDTLPVKYGQRNQRIFYLALYIRSMDGNWDKKPTGFRWAVQEWHRQALPNIKTKEFEGTWLDFMVAWNNLVHGVIDPLQILEFCRTLEPPSKIVKDWPKRPELHLL